MVCFMQTFKHIGFYEAFRLIVLEFKNHQDFRIFGFVRCVEKLQDHIASHHNPAHLFLVQGRALEVKQLG